MRKISCILLTIFLTFSLYISTQISDTYAAEALKIHYIDVGSGDSIYIEYGGESLLIDGGYLTQYDRFGEADETKKSPIDKYMHDGDRSMVDTSIKDTNEQFKKVLTDYDNSNITKYLDSLGVKQIDYVISSHPHYDHIGGLIQVLNKYPYKHLISNGRDYSGFLPAFKRLATYNEKKTGVALTTAKQGQVIELGKGTMKAKFTILSDQTKDYTTISGTSSSNTISNNESLVIRLDYGKRSFLFTGDAQVAAQRNIMETSPHFIKGIDFLKVPHHGYNNNDFGVSDKSGNYEFFQLINPAVSIVQCGVEGANVTLPTNKVLNDLSMSDIYTTKDVGNIVLTCDGNKVTLKYKTSTIYAFNPGDLNKDGKISASDLLKMEKYIVDSNKNKLKNTEFKIADINNDGKVNSRDMLAIEKNIVFGTPIY